VSYDHSETGNVLKLIESSWDLLRPHLTETRFSKDATFKTEIRYPELACREALINAIAHRDYSVEGRGIEIHVYSDRLEIINPGSLLSTVKIEDIELLKGVHDSRNSYIARVLKEAGYMRELGEGIRRIYEEMNLNELEKPQIQSDNNEFRMILHYRSVYSREEKLWLENFERFNLTREQKAVIRLGYNNQEITPNQIYEVTGIVDVHQYNQFITTLREMGILRRTVARDKVKNLRFKLHKNQRDVPQFAVDIPQASRKTDGNIIFIGNLPYGIEQIELTSKLQAIFGVFGEIIHISTPVDRIKNVTRGFAFITFRESEAVEKAITKSSNLNLDGRKLLVNRPKHN
jgi:ATP-dependent DNA helicase RecG